jgi:uncharacterized protein YjbI with pentapeptide repeats
MQGGRSHVDLKRTEHVLSVYGRSKYVNLRPCGSMPDRDAAQAPFPPDLDPELPPLDAVSGESVVGARIEHADLGGARLPALRLVDVELSSCNLANVKARGASLVRCVLRGCRLTGASFAEGRLTDVLFEDCRVDLAAFTGATLERVTFEGCRMTQSDLQEAACESVRLLACDLSECDLTGARFKRSELRRCELDGLRGVERLRGVGVGWDDLVVLAPALADALGIRLLDVPDD